MVTDEQVKKLMKEYEKDGRIGRAAMCSNMDEKTARKYVKAGKLPSEMKKPRTWRTREDPFADDWADMEQRLDAAPELQAKALFQFLCRQKPGKYQEGQLRTFQRRVKQWRAEKGPPQEVFFPQEHRPGEAMQTDFTDAGKLDITIAGEPFDHLLCSVVLPYSNWQWVTICHSESMVALRHGVQEAIFRLGHVPEYHQTDNSSAATHELPGGKRGYNDDYQALMEHLGMTPRTIAIGQSHQNGDVESLHGWLKNRLRQHLALRGSRDFDSVDAYRQFLRKVFRQANDLRTDRLKEELGAMRQLTVKRLPAFERLTVRVTRNSTIRVKNNIYSVPSRLKGETVRVRLYDDRLEVFYGQSHQETIERLRGEGNHRINYRHIIWSLVKKPGAFPRYRYRDDLFPTIVFREAYDALCERHTDRRADLEYLRILHLAASTMEVEVQTALRLLMSQDALAYAEDVKQLVAPHDPEVPELDAPDVDLAGYDDLLGQGVSR